MISLFISSFTTRTWEVGLEAFALLLLPFYHSFHASSNIAMPKQSNRVTWVVISGWTAAISSMEVGFLTILILCTKQQSARLSRKDLTAKKMGGPIMIISDTNGSLPAVHCQGTPLIINICFVLNLVVYTLPVPKWHAFNFSCQYDLSSFCQDERQTY